MQIIKERVTGSKKCIIRTNCYGSQLSFFLKLFETATADFPSLESKDVVIVHFGGSHYSGTFGIEFDAPSPEAVPEAYFPVRQVEMTR